MEQTLEYQDTFWRKRGRLYFPVPKTRHAPVYGYVTISLVPYKRRIELIIP